jgi:hypothetical protein
MDTDSGLETKAGVLHDAAVAQDELMRAFERSRRRRRPAGHAHTTYV